jgi:hypothetical protein
MKADKGVEVLLHIPFPLALDKGEHSALHPSYFTLGTAPSAQWRGGLVGPRAWLNALQKIKFLGTAKDWTTAQLPCLLRSHNTKWATLVHTVHLIYCYTVNHHKDNTHIILQYTPLQKIYQQGLYFIALTTDLEKMYLSGTDLHVWSFCAGNIKFNQNLFSVLEI